jgi:hypothetical protein
VGVTEAPQLLTARSMVGNCEQAIQSGGYGFWTGFGTMLRKGMSKYLP